MAAVFVVPALVWLLVAPQADALRQDVVQSQALLSQECDPISGCSCWDERKCSSCSLPSCGIDSIVKVWELSGGTQKLRPDLPAAYGLQDATGKKWAIKLKEPGDAWSQEVRASQLAHSLGIPTPRVLPVSPASCPAVFAHLDIQEGVKEFEKQGKKFALLQEFVGNDLPCAPKEPFWKQVGRIAMFGWLRGRRDLFNDLLLDGVGSVEANLYLNKDNIMETKTQAVEIDLEFSEGCCDDDFSKILSQLKAGISVEWVTSHVMLLMCEARHGGMGMSSCRTAYNSYNAFDPNKTPKGWDEILSRTQIELGMAELAQQVLKGAGDSAGGFPRNHAYVSLMDELGEKQAEDITNKLKDKENSRISALLSEGQVCCAIDCEYKSNDFWKLWSWTSCGTKDMYTRTKQDGCPSDLGVFAQANWCTQICKRGRKSRGTVHQRLGACGQ